MCLYFRSLFQLFGSFKESHDVQSEIWLAAVVSSDSLQLILTRQACWTKRGGEVRSLKTPTLCRAQWTHHVGQQQQLTFSLNRRFWLHSWLQRGSGWSPWRGGTPWLRGFHGNPSAAAQKRRHHIFGSFSVHLWPFCFDLSVSCGGKCLCCRTWRRSIRSDTLSITHCSLFSCRETTDRTMTTLNLEKINLG